ncbi:hypothetical protein SEA_MAREELIH_35 [Gordonia phage Mareelih]|nr:hypothetical protein SEA_MAREELIH_35 [Gordonia phage Mareelih]
MTKHLWEYDHPYYCESGNYLANYDTNIRLGITQTYGSWNEFLESEEDDPELNLLFRWDWFAWHLEDPEMFKEGEKKHELHLFFMLQRKVTEWDEPSVHAWLTERAQNMRQLWEPLLGE